jgi:hypothetical protein
VIRSTRFAWIASCLLVLGAAVQAADYPLTLAASAQVAKGATTVTTTFTIHVDRVMNETFRTRVTDALKFGGYPKFLPALRALPAIGTIAFDERTVELRYVREEPHEKGIRLVLVADRPLFYLGDATKARAGYELTMVDLTLDAKGAGTGTMTGAARVKPTPDGGIVVDEFEVAPVQLTVRRVPEK